MIPIVFRDKVETDIGYLLDSFLSGAYYPVYGQMSFGVYRRRYRPMVLNLIHGCSVIVACLPDQPDEIAGFIIFEKFEGVPVIHWVHTRGPFLRQGIGTSLIKAAIPSFGVETTLVSHKLNPGIGEHQFKITFRQMKEKYLLCFDPFLVDLDRR
jgi:hypothetical protein